MDAVRDDLSELWKWAECCIPAGDCKKVHAVIAELRAAREAVKRSYQSFRRNFYHEVWDDALKMVAENMKEARNG